MGLECRRRTAPIVAAICMFVAAGCSDDSSPDPGTTCCSSTRAPVFLESKLDDDDGDGNPVDEDFPAINDEDDDIADHAWIRDRFGLWHLFFHNEGLGSGSDIEHYTSADLQHLDYAGLALTRNPAGWDSAALWAPHVVEAGGTYFMFYAGIEGRGAGAKQRIGLAVSTDLATWTRYPANNCPGTTGDGCIYECNECWTTWSREPGSYNQQCRDPFVIRDPAQGRWVLFATAKGLDESGVVTVAYSQDLVRWTGAGWIEATRRLASGIGGQPTGGQAENAFVVQHAGTYFLFFSDWRDPEDPDTVPNPRTIVQYVTSPSLTADTLGSRQWIYRGYIPDPGVNAIEVLQLPDGTRVMSQSISNENCTDHTLHRRDLRLKCIVWGDGVTFATNNMSGFQKANPGCAPDPLVVDPQDGLR